MSQSPARVRDLGIVPGVMPTGPNNSLTDVEGVTVGQVTLREGADIRTGVTAIVPTQFHDRKMLRAGLFVGNGFGKLIGATQLAELGAIETPIVLTGTLSAFKAADALVTWMLAQPGNEEMRTVNPLVGETNDGFLSDIRARPITEHHVLAALEHARPGPVAEGAVGAGTGTSALGFKAGIGTSSRVVLQIGSAEQVTIGVLVQSNFSGTLTVLGTPIDAGAALRASGAAISPQDDTGGNSCMIVVATDARVDGRQLGRLAKRAVFAMAHVGADFSHGSGDYAIAFTTSDGTPIQDADLDPLFAAVMEATEEALLNSLFMATTTTGFRDHVRYAVPHEFVQNQLTSRR